MIFIAFEIGIGLFLAWVMLLITVALGMRVICGIAAVCERLGWFA